MKSSRTIARIALPVALAKPLYYAIPANLLGMIKPGHRVKVPLRGRQALGFVLDLVSRKELSELGPDVKLREIEALDPDQILLIPKMLPLMKWVSRYYVAPLGMAIEAALPKSIARPPKGMFPAEDETSPAIQNKGKPGKIVLNTDQCAAVSTIREAIKTGSGISFLLHGVTGSGKTEVYLHAVDAALEMGLGVLFLVPEIALGTQIVRQVRERFGDQVVEYHSQLKPSERRMSWWKAWSGQVSIVTGARSAVFAPVRNLGLIIIDEEHEPSYKQSDTPRYHGRDTALMRAHLSGAVTVMGSATPSLESRRNADSGKYQLLTLPERVDNRTRPQVTLVDMRGITKEEGENPAGLRVVAGGDRDPKEPLSPVLLDNLEQVVARGDQAILFLNRRGFSTSVQCRDCGYLFECPRCSVTLTHHRTERNLRCHYCNHTMNDITECPKCRSGDFSFTGAGTQRVETSLEIHLPEARVLRMDLDSTRKRGVLKGMIESFEKGEADILLGTQMVAKGFDFPRVTFVGVISADREMGLPDFRGQERAFQLLTQVAGRAGRGKKSGEVMFQTYLPEHHVISAAGQQDYNCFYQQEMAERKPLGYPPHQRMANLLFDGADEAAVIKYAQKEADQLGGESRIMLLGPAPMPLSRLKGQYRWHLTLISAEANRLTRVLHGAVDRALQSRSSRVRVQVDMDPASML